MQRWGKTAAGITRWYCPLCQRTGVRKRIDVSIRSKRALFTTWLTGTKSLAEVAATRGSTVKTLERWFSSYWCVQKEPVERKGYTDVLIVDGLYLESRNNCVLIGKTKTAVTHWAFAERETYGSWVLFCRSIPAPRVVVCDGQRGMRAAIRDAWPNTRIQRCIVHVFQLALARLTQRPKTQAGYTLKTTMHQLLKVRTRRQKRRWIREYRRWSKRYEHFLKERTIGEQPGRKRTWWYTHKKMRSVRTLLDHALPDLFTYIGHPEIPRTTNHVEGGINSRLAELIYRHRGLPLKKKEVLVATFLSGKQIEKPTRNVY